MKGKRVGLTEEKGKSNRLTEKEENQNRHMNYRTR